MLHFIIGSALRLDAQYRETRFALPHATLSLRPTSLIPLAIFPKILYDSCMDYRRFYSDGQPIDGTVTLTGAEFLHCTKVTRHKVGFTIIVCCGDGFDYICKITEIGRDSLTALVTEKKLNTAESSVEITLYQANCKELDFIVRKAVELGVARIVPVTTRYSQSGEINLSRLTDIVKEASKQCGRARLPEVVKPVDFKCAITGKKADETGIFCYEKCPQSALETPSKPHQNPLQSALEVPSKLPANPLQSALQVPCKPPANALQTPSKPHAIALFIGSEGGFSEEEACLAEASGWHLTSLGRRILRAETASIVAITLALNAVGEL